MAGSAEALDTLAEVSAAAAMWVAASVAATRAAVATAAADTGNFNELSFQARPVCSGRPSPFHRSIVSGQKENSRRGKWSSGWKV